MKPDLKYAYLQKCLALHAGMDDKTLVLLDKTDDCVQFSQPDQDITKYYYVIYIKRFRKRRGGGGGGITRHQKDCI